jgi:arginine deiminase
VTNPSANYGVHSEVGKLRKVLVCSPGLAHERLTPTNCDDLLFDDVLWVQNARRDHFDFIDKLRLSTTPGATWIRCSRGGWPSC